MNTWQYQFLTISVEPDADDDDAFDRMGVAGWELVTVLIRADDPRYATAFFKRQA
jgi:hypothetical protein